MNFSPTHLRTRREGGFTLVELAISLLIIGLLIGGVLRGRELIENARVVATVKQVKGYMAASAAFVDAYGTMAGDMANATARLKNCDSNVFCMNGNGNGYVGTPILTFTWNLNQAGISTMPQVETSMFWKHLALAGMISGINAGANPATAEWGQTHPANSLTGGFSIFYYQDVGSAVVHDKGVSHVLRLQASPTSTGYSYTPGQDVMPVTARQAYKIDMKMDDGLGDKGFVTADHEMYDCDFGDAAGGLYSNNDTGVCVMYFQIQ